jgi:hypothetical protein
MSADFEFVRSPWLLLMAALSVLCHVVGSALLHHRVRKVRSSLARPRRRSR